MADQALHNTASSKRTLYFHYAGLTDTGMVRDHNEDAYKIPLDVDPETLTTKGHLYILADGMGGHQKGEIASDVTIRTISQEYYATIPKLTDKTDLEQVIIEALNKAIMKANENVMYATEGGGTTVVTAVLHDSFLVTMNVGDSRSYLLRNNKLQLISKDHSLVSRLVEMGKITEEQALSHPRRNVLYQALGQGTDVDIYIYQTQLKVKDVIILCSDGLWGEVPDGAIQEVLHRASSPLEAAKELIELANESGGNDNITAIIVQVLTTPPQQPYQPIEEGAFPPSAAKLLPKPETLPEGHYYVDSK